MPGASKQARRVTILNANWVAGTDGGDGQFEVMIVTDDDRTDTVPVSPASITALIALTQAGNGAGMGSCRPHVDCGQRRGHDALDREPITANRMGVSWTVPDAAAWAVRLGKHHPSLVSGSPWPRNGTTSRPVHMMA